MLVALLDGQTQSPDSRTQTRVEGPDMESLCAFYVRQLKCVHAAQRLV